MPQADQGTDLSRYVTIPRTAIFLRRDEEYLLLKGAPTKRLWAGKYNCLGGHVERGEDVITSARRELEEEAGLTADLWLCGTVLVDAGEAGICLFVILGENVRGDPKNSREGMPEWIPIDRLHELPVVEDLPILLARIHKMKKGDAPFAARSYYDEEQRLKVMFAE